MIATLRRLFGIKTQAEREAVEQNQAEQIAWQQRSWEASQKYTEIYERLKDEPADLSVLPKDIVDKLLFLFADNNFNMSLAVGGARGINADLYFTWRSGSTRTVFQEKDYGTEQFIRMVKAAHKLRDVLHERRQEALRALVSEIPS